MVSLRTQIISAKLTWTPRMDLYLQPFTCNNMYKKQTNYKCKICSNMTPTKTSKVDLKIHFLEDVSR